MESVVYRSINTDSFLYLKVGHYSYVFKMADENDILRGFSNRCTATKTIWLKFLFITATHLFQPQAPKG